MTEENGNPIHDIGGFSCHILEEIYSSENSNLLGKITLLLLPKKKKKKEKDAINTEVDFYFYCMCC